MNKLDRLKMIQSRFSALFGKSVTEVLPVSRREIKQIGKEIQSKFSDSMNDSLLSGDEFILRSSLELFSGVKQRESDAHLSERERKQLARELNLFKLNQSKEKFKSDVQKTPLLLMA